MLPLLPTNAICRYLSRRWYRFLSAVAACFVLGVPIASAFLFGLNHTNQSILFGALSGIACAFFFGLVQASMSMVGAMRCPASIRAALAIVIPVFAVASLKHVPVNLEIQSVPIILTYSLCFGSLVMGIVFRHWLDEELVGSGGRLMTRSPQWCDVVLVVAMAVFFWAQYRSIGGGWYGSMTSPRVLVWALILSVASAWSFVALSRFCQRRKAYSLAIPLSVVAMFMLYLQFRLDTDSLMPWSGFLAFAVMAPIGWCLSQECSSRALVLCNWQWRPIRRRTTKALPVLRERIRRSELGWRSMAALFLVVVVINIGFIYANQTYRFEWNWFSAMSWSLFQGVSWAGLASFAVLTAHHSRQLLLQTFLIVGFWFAAIAIGSPKTDYDSIFSNTTLIASAVLPVIPMALIAHTLVRILDERHALTIGIIAVKRRQVGINDLMMLTLILGCGFALMRFTEPGIVVFTVCQFAIIIVTTFLMFRFYFIGPSLGSTIAAVTLLAITTIFGYLFRISLGQEFFISVFVFIAANVAIVRWLGRVGWRKIELVRSTG